MNFNIYVENETGRLIESIVRRTGRKKNEIIREAINDWVKKYSSLNWPDNIINWQGEISYVEPESSRIELLQPKDQEF